MSATAPAQTGRERRGRRECRRRIRRTYRGVGGGGLGGATEVSAAANWEELQRWRRRIGRSSRGGEVCAVISAT